MMYNRYSVIKLSIYHKKGLNMDIGGFCHTATQYKPISGSDHSHIIIYVLCALRMWLLAKTIGGNWDGQVVMRCSVTLNRMTAR